MRNVRKGLIALLCGYMIGGCLADKISREDLERRVAEYQATHEVQIYGTEDVVGSGVDTENDIYNFELSKELGIDITNDIKETSDSEVDIGKDVTLEIATSCYNNYFQSQNLLNDIIAQNGKFGWNSGQYLQQIDNSDGWKVAYFNNFVWENLMLQAKVKMPNEQTGFQKVGLLFRYNPESDIGYDANEDKGYAISLKKNVEGKFSVVLEDFNKGEINNVLVEAKINDWHTLGVKAVDVSLTAYFDGKEIFQFKDAKYGSGVVGVASYDSEGNWDNLLSCLP